MASRERETCWIDVEIRATSKAAIQVYDGKRTAWIPRSQIIDEEEDLRKGVETRVEIPVWLLEKSGLV